MTIRFADPAVGAHERGTENGAVSILRADPDLAPGISAQRRAEAQRRSAARILKAEGPRLQPVPMQAAEGGYGLLVLSGALCRRIVCDDRVAAELVGAGDLIRPWEPSGDWSSLPVECDWTVVRPAHLAILDRAFAVRVASFPEIPIGLNRRSLRRATRAATMLSTLGQPRVEDRLLAMFSHLADRFGRTRPGCVVVPLPLTHGLLAELVGARRPSVTKALASLREDGALERDGDGWLLRGKGGSPFVAGPPPS